MSHPYQGFVTAFTRLLDEAGALPLGGFMPPPLPDLRKDASAALVFAPHPDDESIVGALALRLRRELGHPVAVVAVTLGSRPERQAARLEELRGACAFLGFEVIPTAENGLIGINAKAREAEGAQWRASVSIITNLLADRQPPIIFVPHARDWNSTHVGTHLLVMDALQSLGEGFTCTVVETEFWGAMEQPNLMIESTPEEVADLVAALTFHRGEVARNPYHVLLPSWMSDNVRRGAELVGGQGGTVPAFRFATLYRLSRWTGKALEAPWRGGHIVPSTGDLTQEISWK